MEFENLVKLIQTVSESGLTGFQYEEKGMKVKMSREGETVQVINTAAAEKEFTEAKLIQSVSSVQETKAADDLPEEGKLILSPLVGTFYTAPSEDAAPYVAVGDTVKKGQTLAIVEAMKLMNEIESEYDGVVEEVLAENGQPVEYNQPLFRLK